MHKGSQTFATREVHVNPLHEDQGGGGKYNTQFILSVLKVIAVKLTARSV